MPDAIAPHLPIDTHDPKIHAALLKLGWTPPRTPAKWWPQQLSKCCWQAARDRLVAGNHIRDFDSAVDRLESERPVRKPQIYATKGECELRCIELNRRQWIG